MNSLLESLENKIEIQEVPFSYPGSRLTVFRYPNKSSLYIWLAERLIEFFPGIESYSKQPPLLDEFILIDENRDPLDFQLKASPWQLEFTTRIGIFLLSFVDESTLCIQIPRGVQAGIRFQIPAFEWEPDPSGGSITSYRNLQYSSNGKILVNKFSKSEKHSTLDFICSGSQSCSILLSIGKGFKNTPPGTLPQHSPNKAAAIWQNWFEHIPPVNEYYRPMYAYAWWVLFNNMFSPAGNLRHTVIAPSKKNYIGIWLWDNALHALALRHFDPQLARDQILAFLPYQQKDGMLPDAIFDEGIVTELPHPTNASVTKPPILAWAALKIHEIDPNPEFLQKIYDPLVRWNRWWFESNDADQDGYIGYNHPFSSGMDDNPTWDEGMPVESPDINTYLYLQMEALSKMAQVLGKQDDAKIWEIRASQLLATMIGHAWDEEKGYFSATHNHLPVSAFTPINLFPLWTSALPEHMKKSLITHLSNPQHFWGQWMLPSVAYDDLAYDPGQMWRGPVWINVNYFFIEALQKNKEKKLADELLEKTLSIMMNNSGIYEYYNSKTGGPGTYAAAAFSWSAALFIDLAIQTSKKEIKTSKDRS